MNMLLKTAIILAHSWYPQNCCTDKDCRPLEFGQVQVTPKGYIVPSGELIPYNDPRIKDTPADDPMQRFHWCTVGGLPKGHVLCLFVPSGGA